VREQTLEILERKAKDRHEMAQLSRERSRVDDLLHEVILANLGNAVVVELFDRLRIVVQISRVALPPRFLDSLPGLREHLLVIAAIEARDAATAERLMFWHLEMGRRRSVGID
jgi:DNA-binding GntR family transcriptional regulator